MQDLNDYYSSNAIFFFKEGILVRRFDRKPILPLGETAAILKMTIQAAHGDKEVIISQAESTESLENIVDLGYEIIPLRVFLSDANIPMQNQVLRGYHWINWNAQSQFCGKCGQALVNKFNQMEKKCEKCQLSFFPKFSPAVMVIIHRKNEILLARSAHFRPGVYSAIAGFIEPGESAEQAAHREVREELGIEITNLTYFSSQAWPFPDSFMIAFKAEYLSGELQVDKQEIEAAHWYPLQNLPKLPFKASIAWALINSLVSELLPKN